LKESREGAGLGVAGVRGAGAAEGWLVLWVGAVLGGSWTFISRTSGLYEGGRSISNLERRVHPP
jgi:hypothetical protein